jgi:hypothetical protein
MTLVSSVSAMIDVDERNRDLLQALQQAEEARLDLAQRLVNADNLAPDVSLCLFRIMQEALHNVAKLNHATKINIELDGTSDSLLPGDCAGTMVTFARPREMHPPVGPEGRVVAGWVNCRSLGCARDDKGGGWRSHLEWLPVERTAGPSAALGMTKGRFALTFRVVAG